MPPQPPATITATITAATAADAPALAQLINRAYRGEDASPSAAPAGWTTERHLLDGPRIDAAALRALLAAPRATLLKATTTAGALVGCIHLEQQDNILYFSLLAVNPAAQATGLGQLLLLAAEAWARQAHCTTLKISVLAQRPELLAWYERRGYRQTGPPEPFPDTTRFGRPRRALTLLTLIKSIS